MSKSTPTSPIRSTDAPASNAFSFDDFEDDVDGGWQEMPVVREDLDASGFDEEDRKKYRYVSSENAVKRNAENATGNLIDFDYEGTEWRSKLETDVSESEYTRLRVHEESSDAADEMQLRTKYLFDEDKAMTPLAQMATTKRLLTEAQRVAYVGVCQLTIREMSDALKPRLDHRGKVRKDDKVLVEAKKALDLWALKIMGRLYYHMDIMAQEQKMIESLGQHGVLADDLVPALMATHTVANPEYDPEEAKIHHEEVAREKALQDAEDDDDDDDKTLAGDDDEPTASKPSTFSATDVPPTPVTATVPGAPAPVQTTTQVLPSTTVSVPGVSTTLNSYEREVTLDIRWTLLCDLFLVLTADSVYDARSRVLLEKVATHLGLGWKDLVHFEGRVTEALEIEEAVEKERLGEGKQEDILNGVIKRNQNKRYMMLGLATLGGGLVIGLSAGLLAPVIGVGIAGAFTTIGVTGTTGFLAGAGGAAVITTGGVLTGSGIAVRGMANRTKQVRTFDLLPLHNNKRVSCILTVPGFLNGPLDDPRLPFSVLDPIVGDVFSVLWEPEMIRETGSALRILTGEVLTQIGQTVLAATVMAALMSALQWPIILTKLGYLIDNPWSNALDRAKAAGSVLADVLIQRHLGVRPITLIGFSLGARVIFYALLELAKQKAFGIVQDVVLLGTTLSTSTDKWCMSRSVVSGRYINAYARNDWVLNYLFRASSGGVGTVAGLRPVENVPGLENVDVTDKIAGHMSYRTFMPLILDQLGFPVERDYFDDPSEPDFEEAEVTPEEEEALKKKKAWFGAGKVKDRLKSVSKPPAGSNSPIGKSAAPGANASDLDDDLPPRESEDQTPTPDEVKIPKHAGFDFGAIKAALAEEQKVSVGSDQVSSLPPMPPIPPPTNRSESTPPSLPRQSDEDESDGRRTPTKLEDFLPTANRTMSMGVRSTSDSAPKARMEEPSPSSWSENPFMASSSSSSSSSSSPPPPSLNLSNPFANASTASLSSSSWATPVASTRSEEPPSMSFGNPDGTSMSFGGPDGSLDQKKPSEDDNWRMPPLPAQKGFGVGANPWG